MTKRVPLGGPPGDRRPQPSTAEVRGRLLSGFGSPEGKVPAGAGTLWQDTDPEGPGLIYRKTTEGGNTGWEELGAGGGGGFEPYAIHLKARGGDITISDNDAEAIEFTHRYYEIQAGTEFPAISGTAPPDPGESMWSSATPSIIYVPIDGLWAIRGAYRYDAMPLGTFVQSWIDHSNTAVAMTQHSREATDPGGPGRAANTVMDCEVFGTTWAYAGDTIRIRSHQISGGNATIEASGSITDDIPATGPVFAMWLITPTFT